MSSWPLLVEASGGFGLVRQDGDAIALLEFPMLLSELGYERPEEFRSELFGEDPSRAILVAQHILGLVRQALSFVAITGLAQFTEADSVQRLALNQGPRVGPCGSILPKKVWLFSIFEQ